MARNSIDVAAVPGTAADADASRPKLAAELEYELGVSPLGMADRIVRS
ncbi:MAG TPA: hypothetical protein VLB89_07550 [Gaiellaceae bacterium]|nr:hypothetical protein [Gaiellaceae bacterium]